MRSKFLIIVITILFNPLKSISQNTITKYMEFGKYPVGYKIFHTYDNGRSYFTKYDYYKNRTDKPIGRPMQISLWYPAKNIASSKEMVYKDYIGYWASETDFNKNTPNDRSQAINNFIKEMEAEKQRDLSDLLNEKTHAFLDAAEIEKDFPVILYAPPMNTSATDNSIICEYLASKGYILLSVMAKGEYDVLQNRTVRDVHTQAEDLSFLLGFAKRKYKSEKLGVFGFSLGGLANIIFASKHKGIDATISLDGSIMSQGWLDLIEDSEFYNPNDFTSNILLIGKNLKEPEQNPATFYDNVKYADKVLIRYDHDQHSYFSGLNLLYEMVSNDTLAMSEKEKNYQFYAEMSSYVSSFFDMYLKNSSLFEEKGQKLYEHSFTFEKGSKKPLNPSSIGQNIIDNGFHLTNEIINDILTYEKEYLSKLDWRGLQRTSVVLQNGGRLDEAIETLLLSNKAFPDWYLTNYNLGKLYLEKGDTTLSVAHFKMALKDNPRHSESLNSLKSLNRTIPDYHLAKVENLEPYLGKYIVDKKRNRRIYVAEGRLYLESNYWDEPVELWPYSKNVFLVESDNPRYNMQVIFEFDEKENVKHLLLRGLNSGRINEPNLKE
jgi:tetratricopeptide (TPR) repeat protein